MEGSHSSHQYWMYVKRDYNNNFSWEERAFAEDAARILGHGSMWPQRSFSCTFCNREFRSAQALGGHMNIHRRDRARLKQNLSPHHHHHHHHKNDDHFIKSLLGTNHHFSAPDHDHKISTQIDCGLTHHACYSSPATTITTTRLSSCISSSSPQENCTGQHNFSEQEGVVKASKYNFNGLMGCSSNYVETSLSVGLTSMLGRKSPSPTVPCGDTPNISCKRLKTTISSLPALFLKPCSNDKSLAFQPQEIPLGLHHGMEDMDLELRLGKQKL